MIFESKKLFFNTINIVLEDDKLDEIIKSDRYAKIIVTSYKRMDLPKFDLMVKTTALIDLVQNEEDIFKKFSDTTKNEIRRTYKNADLNFFSDDNNFDESYRLYKNFEYNQSRVPVSKKELKNCKLFCALHKGSMISAIYVMESFPYLRMRSIFSLRLKTSDKELYKIMSNATRRIIWEICLWGKKQGFRSLDMASVNFRNPKTASITKFKMSFGGEVVNEYTYIYKSKLFRFFEKFVFLKLVLMRIFHK